MIRPLLLSLLPLAPFMSAPAATATPRETVILIHGLNRTRHSMSKLEKGLRAEGYAVLNCGYPSRQGTIETLSTNLFAALTPQLSRAPKVHFVTHSLGGTLLRAYLQDHPLPNLGRVVMLGPPSGGSEVVDRLGRLALFRWINGPAGTQLGTSANGLPAQLKAPAFDLGVIAGDRSVNPFLSLMIPGADDGKVSVQRARTEGMRDFVRLHVTHTFMMRNRQVIRQTRHFLRTGCFQKPVEQRS
jgi:pimeloyl-ACP methyl ester carboxylesterase